MSLYYGGVASILAGRSSDFYDNSHGCIGLQLAQVIHHKTKTIKAANIEYWKDAKTIEVVKSSNQTPELYFSVAVFLSPTCFVSCYTRVLHRTYQSGIQNIKRGL